MMEKRTLALVSLGLCIWIFARAAHALDEEEDIVYVNDAEGSILYAADAVHRERVTFVYDDSGAVVATVDQDGVVTDWQQLFAESGEERRPLAPPREVARC